MSKSSDIEKLRQALDDSVLTHTGRSIGDLASQRVIDDIWPLMQALAAPLVEIAHILGQPGSYIGTTADEELCCALCKSTESAPDSHVDGCSYLEFKHTADCPISQARALLASASEP